MLVILRDGVGLHRDMEIPDGHTFVDVHEMVPHIQDYSGRAAHITEVPTLVTRYLHSGRYDQATGAPIFVPDFLL